MNASRKSERGGPAAADAAAAAAARKQFLAGVQLLKSGQIDAAMAALLAAIELGATHFDAYHALGVALLQAGRFSDASAILFQAAALRPNSAPAQWDLGAAYDRQGLTDQAIQAYRRAVTIAPKLAEVWLRLGQLLAQASRMEEAASCLDKAAALKPKTVDACLYRSDAALLREDFVAAEDWARQAVALAPGLSAAHGALAGILYNQGRFDAAAAYFEAALQLDPKSPKSWEGLARCRKYTAADGAIVDRMRAVLRRGDLAGFERMAVHFSIGKVLDDRGDYAEAMVNFDAANRLRAQDCRFDRAGMQALVDRTIRLYTPEFIARARALAVTDATPLFIVGMYRSGTTLAEQILSIHPDIAAGGELTVWAPADLEADEGTRAFDPARVPAAIAKYLAVLAKIGAGAARVTDKLPPNFFRLGAIHALLPNARIIHCQRDPIDTCLSLYSTLFSSPLDFASRKSDLVFYYRQYQRLMAHWRSVLPAEALLDVHYETLIADREAQTRRMIAFAGVPWDANCLAPEQNQRAIGTSSAWQARQPVYTTSVQRWRRYEPWIGELRELLPS